MTVVFLRTFILYLLIILALRIMGKRQLGELQPSEFVVTILISNIATLPIEDTNIPLISGVIPILVLVCFEVITSCITLKSTRMRKIISGSPKVIVRDGKIDQKMMKSLRFSIDDLFEELRSKEIFDLREVMLAIVETTGKVSIYKNFPYQSATPKILNIKGKNNSPPFVVVSGGHIIHANLEYVQLKLDFIYDTLSKHNYKLEDVFLMTADKNRDYYIVLNDAAAH